MSNQASAASSHDDSSDSEEQVNTRALTDLDDVSSMDESPEVDNDLAAGEFELDEDEDEDDFEIRTQGDLGEDDE